MLADLPSANISGTSEVEPLPVPPDPTLSVVVPVKDEADNILPLIAEIEAALGGEEFEIVYVDDGSRDASPMRLSEARAKSPRLQVLTHQSSVGQSGALVTGILAAKAPWIATLDGDGQNDPADIPKLLALVRAPDGTDLVMVCGTRAKRRDTWARRYASRIANGVRARLLHDDTPDTGCGLKLFRREAFLAMPRFNHMHRFLPALARRDGGRIAHVGVNHRPRTKGTSKYGNWQRLWVGIVDLLGVMWLRARAMRPTLRS